MYSEYLVKRKKSLLDYLIIFLIIFAGITATISLFSFLFLRVFGMIAFLAIVGVWYAVYYIISSRNIEYEYLITDGILDIDTIIAKRKRKSLVSIKITQAEIIAPASIEYIEQYNKKGITSTIDASMKNNSIMDYFIVFKSADGIYSRLIFTPDMNTLNMIKSVNPGHTFFE